MKYLAMNYAKVAVQQIKEGRIDFLYNVLVSLTRAKLKSYQFLTYAEQKVNYYVIL